MKTIMTKVLTKVALECLKKLVERADNRLGEKLVKQVKHELEI